uniref:Uncharacterized protein n=1 Tax=Romanomermis culicivorax TaxID=13658 RepID=A0A915HPJ6_ROMCU
FKIVLNVSQDTYLETSLSAGFRFSVNDPDDEILPDSDGRILSPGFSIDVVLQHRIMNRLNWPHGSCEPMSDQKKPKLELCLRYCYQKKIISYCNCTDPKYPIPPDFEDDFGYCGVEKSDNADLAITYFLVVKRLSTLGNCLIQIVSLLSLFENDCDCKDRCHSKYYIYTTSMAKKLEKSGYSSKLYRNLIKDVLRKILDAFGNVEDI